MNNSRTFALNSGFSAISSAKISLAPARASSTLKTPFSSSINKEASKFKSFISCSNKRSAKSCKPFSRAVAARVLRFGRYGRYISSSSVNVSASLICFSSSGDNFPDSVMDFRIASLRLSSSRNC